MKSTSAFVAFLPILLSCAATTPSEHAEENAVVCLSSPIEDGRAHLAEHREELTAEIIRREAFVIADGERDSLRTARVRDNACEPTEEQITPEAYRETRDRFISGFSTPNGECTLRASPTADETRQLLMEDLLSSGLGGASTVQVDGDYLEVTAGAACELSEPFIREYLARRGVSAR